MNRTLLSLLTVFALCAPPAFSADTIAMTPEEAAQVSAASGGTVFSVGSPNTAYAKWFTGPTWLAPLTPPGTGITAANVTFMPGVINWWHTHQGSCQVLIGVSGRGLYQIWNEPVREIRPGVTVTIPEGVKHWHGAAPESWFQHISVMSAGAGTTWLEPVDSTKENSSEGRKSAK